MKTKFEIMRANRVARPAPTTKPAQSVPAMTIDGVKYAEAADPLSDCSGCVFDGDANGCVTARRNASAAFGDDCANRRAIYIKAA